MASIRKTTLATSNPLSITHPGALPYYPAHPLNLSFQRSGTILSINPTVLAWNFTASVGWSLFIGLQGPAIALKFSVEGQTLPNTLDVNLTEDQIDAGLAFGVNLGFQLGFELRESSLKWVKSGWHSHLEREWTTKLNVHKDLEFDLVAVALKLLLSAIDANNRGTVLRQIAKINDSLISSYGIIDSRSNQFASAGQFMANPGVSLPINLVPFIPVLDEINEGLKVVLGSLFLGPVVGMTIPATVKLQQFQYEGNTYGPVQSLGNNVFAGVQGQGPNDGQLHANLQYSSGLTFTLGLKVEVSILKVFHVGHTFEVNILSILGLDPTAGPYDAVLSNRIGANDLELAEVILE